MADYQITSCSTADLSVERFESIQVKWVPFTVNFGDKSYPDDLGQTIPPEQFYRMIEEGAMPTTSQVNEEQYMELWEPYLKEGIDIFHAALSSGISGTYNSACLAAEEMREKYPDRKIYVVDTLCASSGLGLFLIMLAERKAEGMDIDALRDYAEGMKGRIHTWVMATDLTCLLRGGRISRTSYTLGSILNICPLIFLDAEGKLAAKEKIRTKKKAIRTLAEKMFTYAAGGEGYTGRCTISHSACYEDALALKGMIEEHFPHLKGEVEIYNIGSVIGAHTGPGTLVLFFEGTDRNV